MTTTTPKPKRSRPPKSAINLGLKQTARIASKRAIKSTVTTTNPLLKVVLIAGLGAIASYFINKH